MFPPRDNTHTDTKPGQISSSQLRIKHLQRSRGARIATYNPPIAPTLRPTGFEHPVILQTRLEGNWRYLLANCVRTGTAETYTTGWRHFLRMCDTLQCDPFLATPYDGY